MGRLLKLSGAVVGAIRPQDRSSAPKLHKAILML